MPRQKSEYSQVYVRDVPRALWAAVKVRAAIEGITIREWIINLLRREIARRE
jgi:hypothetical protein